jgi:starch-binding outer membrane protein, SusD/RagB family
VNGGNNPSMGVWMLPGDDMTTTGSGNSNTEFDTFSIAAANGASENIFRNAYLVIARANVVLSKLDQVADGVYTDTNLRQYHKGEALFLRGLMNFQLWNFFGTSPVVTTRLTDIDDVFKLPSTGTQLLDQAILDFSEAASLLPDKATWGSANLGRATKNSALGMLGKSLVFRGTVTNATADFSAAVAAFNGINSDANLVADFSDNFAADTENNNESLFEFQAAKDPGENIWLPNDFQTTVKGMSVSCWTPFTEANSWGYGLARWVGTTKLLEQFDAEDPRLPLTIDPTNRYIQKYVYAGREGALFGGGSSINNPRILRYADVLLLKAEAILRSGGSKSEAIALINQVRTRARNMVEGGTFPQDYSAAETDENVILGYIMKERFLELAFEEGHRWFDLRRWHMAGLITLDSEFFSSERAVAFNPEKHLYFPIPPSELNTNVRMKQNPGY